MSNLFLSILSIERRKLNGKTDELGYKIVENGVSVRDLQAALMHILGPVPHPFAYPYQSLNQRWMGPANDPRVRTELLASEFADGNLHRTGFKI